MIRVSAVMVLMGAVSMASAAEPVTIARTIPYANDSIGSVDVRNECDWNTQLSSMVVSQSNGDVVATDKDLSQVAGRVLVLTITEVHTAGGGKWSGGKWAVVHGELREGEKTLGGFDAESHTSGGTLTGCGTLLYIDKALAPQIISWARGGGTNNTMALIQTNDPPSVRKGAETLYSSSSFDRATLDIVAARIEKDLATSDGQMSDALSWLCKVLQKSGDGRYKPFLVSVSNSAADSKLRKYAAAAAKALPDGNPDVYASPSVPAPGP